MQSKNLKDGTETEWGRIIGSEKRKDGIHYHTLSSDGFVSTIPEQLFNIPETKEDYEEQK